MQFSIYIMYTELRKLKDKVENLKRLIDQAENEAFLELKVKILDKIENGLANLEQKFDPRSYEILKMEVKSFEELLDVEDRIRKVNIQLKPKEVNRI